MSEILEKNISYIREYNAELAEKIMSVKEFGKTFEVNSNFSQEYNLVVDGIPVHSVIGAEDEAVSLFNQLPHNTPNSIHIIFGLGLGYVYDVYSQNTSGCIIIFEQDIELLRFVLEAVDFSKEFSKKQTYVVSDICQFEAIFSKVYRYKSAVSFSSLDYYKHNNSCDEVQKEINRLYGLYSHNFSFQAHELYKFFDSTLGDLDKKFKAPLLNDCAGKLKNKPALIVSAGPSLLASIDVIKKYRDNFVIFCVGTALRTLLTNGIVPDFLNIIEKTDTVIHFNFPETKDMMLICESYTNKDVLNKDYKKIFLTSSDELETSRWFLDKRNRRDAYFETKGTVAYHAIYSAYMLGCNPIVLTGQDLAFANGDCYAKGTFYEDLKCSYDEEKEKYVVAPVNYEKFRDSYCNHKEYPVELRNKIVDEFILSTNQSLKTVLGQNGEKLPTTSPYTLFISYISDFGKRYGDKVKLFNCSKGGAQINYFENADLSLVVEKHAFEKLDKIDLFKNLDVDTSNYLNVVCENLKQDVNAIDKLLPLLDKGLPLLDKYKNEIDNKKVFTDKAIDFLDSALNLYISISNEFLYKYNVLIPACSLSVSEILYYLKEYRVNSNLDNANFLYIHLTDFYSNTPKKLLKIKQSLIKTTELLENNNESCTSKS